MLADDINLKNLNTDMKGTEFRVKPLYNLYEDGKITHWGLNVRFKGSKRFSVKDFAPFYFDSEAEAQKACDILNNWSKEN